MCPFNVTLGQVKSESEEEEEEEEEEEVYLLSPTNDNCTQATICYCYFALNRQ